MREMLVAIFLGCFLNACGPGTRKGDDDDDVPQPDAPPAECQPGTACADPCSPENLGQNYIGCEYYPTVTGNVVGTAYDYAVVIANATNDLATITIDGGSLIQPQLVAVMPHSVKVQTLPWQVDLKLCESTSWVNCDPYATEGAFVQNGAYHLRSTVPVTVYQFNPLQYTLGPTVEMSTSNDASLLLPTNTWGRDYYTAAWQQIAHKAPSELVVVSMRDDTHVTLTTTTDTPAMGGAPAFTKAVPKTVTLARGDVLELATKNGDLTGTHVVADQPIQVFGAHYCADVPETVGFCDHLEESMLSVEQLGTQYVINAPVYTNFPNGKPEVIRIVATEANTTLTYDPPQMAAPTAIANAGDFVELSGNSASFMITANHKVVVAQYMSNDPSMATAVPTGQFRKQYYFQAPTNYETNYLDVTAPTGAHVFLDGKPITFFPIGNTGWSLARVRALDNGPVVDGNHEINGDKAFGISVYGYGQYTSYWYPGGLDLNPILL